MLTPAFTQKLKGSAELLKMHKEFHSTPELCWEQANGDAMMTMSWAPDADAEELEGPEGGPSTHPTAEDWRKCQSQDDVYGLKTKAQNQRNDRRSWAVANSHKKKAGAAQPGVSGSRYHGSWQSIEDSYHAPEDGDDDEETEEEEEDNGDEDGEEAVTPVADQLTLLGGTGDYRAVKPCRPIYSSNTLPKQRAGSPHCNAPPPNHPPPPPPPPSQVVRVDLTKSHSEYAVAAAGALCGSDPRPTTPVMSSFRPSDAAKVYALPEDAKNVGYMTLRPSPNAAKKPQVSLASPSASSPSSSSSSSTSAASRSKSLPPRTARPNVSIKSGQATGNNPEASSPRISLVVNSTPIIPDPDYGSDDDEATDKHSSSATVNSRSPPLDIGQPQSKLRIEIKHQQPPQQHQQQQQQQQSSLPKSQSFCADILKAKSLLKTSQSFPEELSDCQQQQQQQLPPDTDDAYVTFVPVNNGKQSDTVDEGRSVGSHAGRRSAATGSTTGVATRHAVSLIQLPPPAENGETDQDVHSDLVGNAEQDSVSTVSTLSSLSTNSSNSSDRDTTTVLENKPPTGNKKVTVNGYWREEEQMQQQRRQSTPTGGSKTKSGGTDAERTIEESLQLIRRHVDELSGMNNHRQPSPGNRKSSPPVVPPPPLFEPSSDSDDSFLPPPPPEFSDIQLHTAQPAAAIGTSTPSSKSSVKAAAINYTSRTLPKSMSSGYLRGKLMDRSNDDDDDMMPPFSSASHFFNRRIAERRLSDDSIAHHPSGRSTSSCNSGSTVRVVAAVPKKVTFSSDVIDAETNRHQSQQQQQPPPPPMMTMRHFSSKALEEWTIHDTADWLDSLFLNEYKAAFMKMNMNGPNLLRVNNDMLVNLGVKRLGHRLNIEKSLKHYARGPSSD